ncbi:MAG: hypothetical protein LBC85_01120 [Fibromonadaceae bacterium]|jgi:hypothetical protein|nr:hypothetical protein [Fibromonadaceae bacterium]
MMTATKATKVSNMVEIRQTGLKALLDALGPIGMARFMQQYDAGYGDYTKEKYEQADMTVEEVDSALKAGFSSAL